MKSIILLVFLAGIYSCNSESPPKATEELPENTASTANTANAANTTDSLNSFWINDFRDFRNAVYQGDISKVKTYFKFPVLNYHNEIWAVALADSNEIFGSADADPVIPFTEKDFDKYYRRLFSKEFIKSVLKIKSEELLQKNNAETELFNSDSATTYSMFVSVDKKDKTLHMALLFVTKYKDENGEPLDSGEGSVSYDFIIQDDGRLLFKEIRTAG